MDKLPNVVITSFSQNTSTYGRTSYSASLLKFMSILNKIPSVSYICSWWESPEFKTVRSGKHYVC